MTAAKKPVKKSAKDTVKEKMKKQVDATEEKAEIFSGKKDKIGKYPTKDSKNKKPKVVGKEDETDLDKFFKQVEEGFTDIKAIKEKEKDKKPYDGLLGRVEVERVVKTVNK